MKLITIGLGCLTLFITAQTKLDVDYGYRNRFLTLVCKAQSNPELRDELEKCAQNLPDVIKSKLFVALPDRFCSKSMGLLRKKRQGQAYDQRKVQPVQANNQPKVQQGQTNNQPKVQQSQANNLPKVQQGQANNQPKVQQSQANNQPKGQQGQANGQIVEGDPESISTKSLRKSGTVPSEWQRFNKEAGGKNPATFNLQLEVETVKRPVGENGNPPHTHGSAGSVGSLKDMSAELEKMFGKGGDPFASGGAGDMFAGMGKRRKRSIRKQPKEREDSRMIDKEHKIFLICINNVVREYHLLN